MKKEDLFEELGNINERYIMEAHGKPKLHPITYAKWTAAVAGLALIIIAVKPMTKYIFPSPTNTQSNLEMQEDNSQPIGNNVDSNTQNNLEMQDDNSQLTNGNPQCDCYKQELTSQENSDKNNASSNQEEALENSDLTNSQLEEQPPFPYAPTEDAPADSNGTVYPDSNSVSSTTPDYFGGSYLDDKGVFTIVLTEDTSENRQNAAKMFNQKEENIAFVTGTYSHFYLTALQAKISEAMVNKELPFVTSSAVYEDLNRIKLMVTSTDETDLKKLYALDSLGKGDALVIETGEAAGTEELLITNP